MLFLVFTLLKDNGDECSGRGCTFPPSALAEDCLISPGSGTFLCKLSLFQGWQVVGNPGNSRASLKLELIRAQTMSCWNLVPEQESFWHETALDCCRAGSQIWCICLFPWKQHNLQKYSGCLSIPLIKLLLILRRILSKRFGIEPFMSFNKPCDLHSFIIDDSLWVRPQGSHFSSVH